MVFELSSENACSVTFFYFSGVKMIPSLSSIMLSFIKRQKQIASLIDASLAKCFLMKLTSVWKGQHKGSAPLYPLLMAYVRPWRYISLLMERTWSIIYFYFFPWKRSASGVDKVEFASVGELPRCISVSRVPLTWVNQQVWAMVTAEWSQRLLNLMFSDGGQY